MVDGKIDAQGAEPKVLVDHITTELDHVVPLKIFEQQKARSGSPRAKPPQKTRPAKVDPTPSKTVQPRIVTPTPTSEAEWNDEGLPPPPDEFPFGWDDANGVKLMATAPTVEPDPVSEPSPAQPAPTREPEQVLAADTSPLDSKETMGMDSPDLETSDSPEPGSPVPDPIQDPAPAESLHPESPIPEALDPEVVVHDVVGSETLGQETLPTETSSKESQPVVLSQTGLDETILQPIVPPLRSDTAEDVHMITVILRPREDKARDKLLLRRVFGIMISHPGDDRFAFHIFERGRGHLLEFPNLTTGLSPALMAQLHELVGPDNVRVEPITFQ
jgi:hypothetical protein